MARSQTRPAVAGAVIPPYPPADQALLAEVLDEAQQARDALAAVVQLLQGCNPAHQVPAASLGRLLAPVWAQIDQVCGDLATADQWRLQ